MGKRSTVGLLILHLKTNAADFMNLHKKDASVVVRNWCGNMGLGKMATEHGKPIIGLKIVKPQ